MKPFEIAPTAYKPVFLVQPLSRVPESHEDSLNVNGCELNHIEVGALRNYLSSWLAETRRHAKESQP